MSVATQIRLLVRQSGDSMRFFHGVGPTVHAILTVGEEVVANLEPTPLDVRASNQVYPTPLQGSDESAAIYGTLDPTELAANRDQFIFYADIPSDQLDGIGGAAKINNEGAGAAVQINLDGSGGSALRADSRINGTRGIRSTIQGAFPDSTLFDALWGQTVLPTFGAYFIDGVYGRAFAARLLAGASDTDEFFNVLDSLSSIKWSFLNNGWLNTVAAQWRIQFAGIDEYIFSATGLDLQGNALFGVDTLDLDDLISWTSPATPTAAGELGMDTVTGRPQAFIGGSVRDLAHTAEITVESVVTEATLQTVGDTTTETTIFSKVIPANTMGSIGALFLEMFVESQEAQVGQINITFRLKLGGTTLQTITVQGGDGAYWNHQLRAIIANLTTSSQKSEMIVNDAADGKPKSNDFSSSSAVDTTLAQTLEVTAEWASTPGMASSVRMHYAKVSVIE